MGKKNKLYPGCFFFGSQRTFSKKVDTVSLRLQSYVTAEFERYPVIHSGIMNDTLLATFVPIDTPLFTFAWLSLLINEISASIFPRETQSEFMEQKGSAGSGGIYEYHNRSVITCIRSWIANVELYISLKIFLLNFSTFLF